MCGIAGAFGIPDIDLGPMLMAMRHRGPDDSGVLRDSRVALGMARLSIIDTSIAGHQPMTNDDASVWIVYNGEMYNFREERARLLQSGIPFRSQSDTEVLLRLYERHGDKFLSMLRGMFSVAIYDRRGGPGGESLILARDPLGINPLLYVELPGGVLFASELKALLASGRISPQVDAESLRLLLTFGSIAQPATAVRGVRMLPAGHCLVLEAGKQRLEPYWTLGVGRCVDMVSAPYQTQVQAVRKAVGESLRMQLVADVPLGAFLSGGVDSSILVGLMARHASGKVKTFSVGFESYSREQDESRGAQRIANFFGTEHQRTEITGNDIRSEISNLARALDQPSMDGANAYFVSLVTRRQVKVAISGTGGDELFAGYPWFGAMAAYMRGAAEAGTYACSAAAKARVFDTLLGTRFGPRIERCRGAGGFLPRYARLHQAFGAHFAARILHSSLRQEAAVGRETSLDVARQDALAHATVVDRVTALCL